MSREHEQAEGIERPFCRAARFDGEATSGTAYRAVQDLIFDSAADISAYRFQASRLWHVAAVADEPPIAEFQRQLEKAFEPGERVILANEVLVALLHRHHQVMRGGLAWVEAHYHPGRRLP